jgi:hypothetical protein
MNTVTWNSKTTAEVLTEKYIPGWKVLVGRSGKNYYFAYKSLTSDILWGAKSSKKMAMSIFESADEGHPGTIAYEMGLPSDVLGWL